MCVVLVKCKCLYEKHFMGNFLGFPQSPGLRSSEVKGRPGRAATAYSPALFHLISVEFRHSIADTGRYEARRRTPTVCRNPPSRFT
ncbi:unnamed protein product [Stenotrophomonas maltophilia]|nr:unnamed protein product [Stenotrophomonas maltophilia]